MTAVRSSTLLFHAFSRLRCCTGVRWALTIMTSGSWSLARTAISSTLPVPSKVAGTGRAKGAISATTTSRWMAAVSPTASASRALASRRALAGPLRFFGSTCMTKARAICGLCASAFSGFVLQLDRAHWHHRGNGMLVDQLGLAVPAQQHAEIVEPGDIALKFDAIDQEYRDRGFAFADGVEERVLKILLFFTHGFSHFLFAQKDGQVIP